MALSGNVKVKKVRKDAVIPRYATDSAAGVDLYACLDSAEIEIIPSKTVLIPTGISIEIPEDYVGLIYARSGLASKAGLAPANKVGVIDSDYRGEIMVALHNHSSEATVVEKGERIAQLVITPYFRAEFEEVEELNDTERGSGGFGSTGK